MVMFHHRWCLLGLFEIFHIGRIVELLLGAVFFRVQWRIDIDGGGVARGSEIVERVFCAEESLGFIFMLMTIRFFSGRFGWLLDCYR